MSQIDQLSKDTIEDLRRLVKLNRDAAEGFTDAAERVGRDDAASEFRAAAVEHERFAQNIAQRLSESDETDPPDGGTLLGQLHRVWMNLRTALNGNDTDVAIIETARAESIVKAAYEGLLAEPPEPPLGDELKAQYDAVAAIETRLGSLRESEPGEG